MRVLTGTIIVAEINSNARGLQRVIACLVAHVLDCLILPMVIILLQCCSQIELRALASPLFTFFVVSLGFVHCVRLLYLWLSLNTSHVKESMYLSNPEATFSPSLRVKKHRNLLLSLRSDVQELKFEYFGVM